MTTIHRDPRKVPIDRSVFQVAFFSHCLAFQPTLFHVTGTIAKMHLQSAFAVVSTLVVAVSGQTQYTASKAADVAAAKATAPTLSPTSYVKGKSFDRIVQIWLENTDFDMAQGDRTYGQGNISYFILTQL